MQDVTKQRRTSKEVYHGVRTIPTEIVDKGNQAVLNANKRDAGFVSNRVNEVTLTSSCFGAVNANNLDILPRPNETSRKDSTSHRPTKPRRGIPLTTRNQGYHADRCWFRTISTLPDGRIMDMEVGCKISSAVLANAFSCDLNQHVRN